MFHVEHSVVMFHVEHKCVLIICIVFHGEHLWKTREVFSRGKLGMAIGLSLRGTLSIIFAGSTPLDVGLTARIDLSVKGIVDIKIFTYHLLLYGYRA
jgi:hypothetical protein